MNAWNGDELAAIAEAEELDLAALRHDDTLRRPVTMWVVRHGDDLYVRSVNGPGSWWFRGAQLRHAARIEAGGVVADVDLLDADDGINDDLDAEYRRKYSRYAESIIRSITSSQARAATLRLAPRA